MNHFLLLDSMLFLKRVSEGVKEMKESTRESSVFLFTNIAMAMVTN
jgi:hypothetical protein